MDRLSEALAVLPKAMQEQIVERLIVAITTTDLYTAPIPANVVPPSQQADTSSVDDGNKSVSSKDGSSGSPCFNADLQLVALHHARDPQSPPRWNQAIPMKKIRAAWQANAISVPD